MVKKECQLRTQQNKFNDDGNQCDRVHLSTAYVHILKVYNYFQPFTYIGAGLALFYPVLS